MRGLQYHVRRTGGDLRAAAAHHAGQRDRPRVVSDHHVVRVEHALDAVQRDQPLAGLGPPHHDRAGQPGPVERVHRLPGLQHHVVRDVHGERDRPHAGEEEAAAQPERGRGGGGKAGHGPGGEPITAGRVGHPHRPAGGVRFRDRQVRRVGVADPERGPQFPGQPADGQRVPAVRRDRQVKHVIAQFEVGNGIRADRSVRRQHEDAGVVVTEAQFPG